MNPCVCTHTRLISRINEAGFSRKVGSLTVKGRIEPKHIILLFTKAVIVMTNVLPVN